MYDGLKLKLCVRYAGCAFERGKRVYGYSRAKHVTPLIFLPVD